MLSLIGVIGVLSAPEITPLTNESMELIEPGLTCSATTAAGEAVFLTDGALAIVGVDGKAVRVRDSDDVMGLPEEFSSDSLTLTIEETEPARLTDGEEEHSHSSARLIVRTQSGIAQMHVQFSCAA